MHVKGVGFVFLNKLSVTWLLLPHPPVFLSEQHRFQGWRCSWFRLSSFSKGNTCKCLSLHVGHYLVSQHKNSRYRVRVPVYTSSLENVYESSKSSKSPGLALLLKGCGGESSLHFLSCISTCVFTSCLLCFCCSVGITSTLVWVVHLGDIVAPSAGKRLWRTRYGNYMCLALSTLIPFTPSARHFQGRLYKSKREGKLPLIRGCTWEGPVGLTTELFMLANPQLSYHSFYFPDLRKRY